MARRSREKENGFSLCDKKGEKRGKEERRGKKGRKKKKIEERKGKRNISEGEAKKMEEKSGKKKRKLLVRRMFMRN